MFNLNFIIMKTVCGLDVHKSIILMCILQKNGGIIIKEYSTLTCDIESMFAQMQEYGVEEVGMESTGIYWIPIWRILQGHFDLKLINPYFIKQLPGRKTDVKDAQWIATVVQKGLVRGSYVPGKQIQELRQFERRYVRLCEQSTRIEQEMDRQLHRCNIQITNYASKIGSVSVIGVVKGIIAGESTAEQLEKHVHGRIKGKYKEKITASLTGVISSSDRFIFKQNIKEYELILEQQKECLEEMSRLCDQYFSKELQLLCTIPGIQKLSAMIIIAELGVDLKAFVTSAALTGWAGLRPRNDESAKKIKSNKITKGNKYLRRILVQCAWAASRHKNCWLKTKYEQLCVRKSTRKALIAISRKLLVIIWNVLTKQQVYKEFIPKVNTEKRKSQVEYYRKKLQDLEAN
jgi:transposase